MATPTPASAELQSAQVDVADPELDEELHNFAMGLMDDTTYTVHRDDTGNVFLSK